MKIPYGYCDDERKKELVDKIIKLLADNNVSLSEATFLFDCVICEIAMKPISE